MTKIRSRRKKKPPMHFVATCGAGLENLVREEVQSFGGREITSTPGAVHWQGATLESAYRACLWSRFASRILLQLTRFEAADPDMLYIEAGKINWSDHFDPKTTFAVYSTLVKSKLTHSHFASLRIKDAIVDQFRKRTGKRPDIDVRRPGIRINLHVEGTAATLALDLSGDSLHRRGYRAGAGEAPLKESLAAAIVHLAGIRPGMDPDMTILDPMCGSGTLLIEAALILGDSAPGLQRTDFSFMHWLKHSKNLWEKLVAEAIEREDRHADAPWPMLMGYDADPRVVATARKNIINAGLTDRIIVKQRQIARLQPPTARGVLVTNPPYGERLSEKEAVKYLYRCMGRIFRTSFQGWQIGFFTAHPDLADMLGLSWQKRYRLYNGPIKCRLLTGVSPGGTEQVVELPGLQEIDPNLPAMDFANRLQKNCRKLLPWAQEEDITNVRIYDADMPEYNLCVEVYGRRVFVREYPPPASIDPVAATGRFNDALQVIRSLLSVPHSDIFISTASAKTGRKEQLKKSVKLFEVREKEARFLVDFRGARDPGLPLDQRNIRALIAELAQGRTFAALFAHTCSATVAAALGGAVSTVSVEPWKKGLERGRANLSTNGYGGPLHCFVDTDIIQWLRTGRERYGLIHVHLPHFFRTGDREKNPHQEHTLLITLAMGRLAREGVLLFSLNSKDFQPDPGLAEDFVLEDMTAQLRTRDSNRSKTPLHCFRVSHRNALEEV